MIVASFKQSYPDLPEQNLIKMAIQHTIASALNDQDSLIFDHILCDTFPGVPNQDFIHADASKAIQEAITEMGLVATKGLGDRANWFYSKIKTRHGVLVLGNEVSGKSTLISVLANAVDKMEGGKTNISRIDAKSMNEDQLYGFYNSEKVWVDGVLSSQMRAAAQ